MYSKFTDDQLKVGRRIPCYKKEMFIYIYISRAMAGKDIDVTVEM